MKLQLVKGNRITGSFLFGETKINNKQRKMSINCCSTVQSLKVSTQSVKRLFWRTDGAVGRDSAHKGDTGRRKKKFKQKRKSGTQVKCRINSR